MVKISKILKCASAFSKAAAISPTAYQFRDLWDLSLILGKTPPSPNYRDGLLIRLYRETQKLTNKGQNAINRPDAFHAAYNLTRDLNLIMQATNKEPVDKPNIQNRINQLKTDYITFQDTYIHPWMEAIRNAGHMEDWNQLDDPKTVEKENVELLMGYNRLYKMDTNIGNTINKMYYVLTKTQSTPAIGTQPILLQ